MTLFKLAFDKETGELLGTYAAGLDYGDDNPKNFIMIDETTYTALVGKLSSWRVNPETLALYQVEDDRSWDFSLRAEKHKSDIKIASDYFIDSMREKYSLAEIDSWSKQEKGAKELIEDETSDSDDAAFVRTLAETRGVPALALAQRIISNVKEANEKVPLVLGYMQKLQDQIDAIDAGSATAHDQLEAITWPTDPYTFFITNKGQEVRDDS